MKLQHGWPGFDRIRKESDSIKDRWQALSSKGLAQGSYTGYFLGSLSRFVRREIRLKQMDEAGLFLSTNIETFGACNRKCSFCFNDDRFEKRKIGVMEESLWHKIVDEFAAIRFAGRLSPYFYGEPLLDKRLVNLMAYARAKCPLAIIQINTNGDYLTDEAVRRLIVAGVDLFVVTNYDDERKPALDALQAAYPQWVFYRQYTDFEIQNRAGLLYERENSRLLEPCLRPSSQLVMNWNGDVGLCCNDFYASQSLGNARNTPVLSIWQGERFEGLRRTLQEPGGRERIAFCSNCDMSAPEKVY